MATITTPNGKTYTLDEWEALPYRTRNNILKTGNTIHTAESKARLAAAAAKLHKGRQQPESIKANKAASMKAYYDAKKAAGEDLRSESTTEKRSASIKAIWAARKAAGKNQMSDAAKAKIAAGAKASWAARKAAKNQGVSK
jgi:hypothetical protein